MGCGLSTVEQNAFQNKERDGVTMLRCVGMGLQSGKERFWEEI